MTSIRIDIKQRQFATLEGNIERNKIKAMGAARNPWTFETTHPIIRYLYASDNINRHSQLS